MKIQSIDVHLEQAHFNEKYTEFRIGVRCGDMVFGATEQFLASDFECLFDRAAASAVRRIKELAVEKSLPDTLELKLLSWMPYHEACFWISGFQGTWVVDMCAML